VPKLVRHLEHGVIPIDNNYIGAPIKHYATGREHGSSVTMRWSPGERNLYSLVMTLPRQ